MSLLVFTAFPLWAVSELVNENFQGGCNFQGIPAYSFACSLDTLHCEFASQFPHCLRLQLLASIAQLAEHALRKRTVVGSISTGGFITSLHHHAQHHHLKNQDLFLSRSFDIVPSLASFFSSSAREAERAREREREREKERERERERERVN